MDEIDTNRKDAELESQPQSQSDADWIQYKEQSTYSMSVTVEADSSATNVGQTSKCQEESKQFAEADDDDDFNLDVMMSQMRESRKSDRQSRRSTGRRTDQSESPTDATRTTGSSCQTSLSATTSLVINTFTEEQQHRSDTCTNQDRAKWLSKDLRGIEELSDEQIMSETYSEY